MNFEVVRLSGDRGEVIFESTLGKIRAEDGLNRVRGIGSSSVENVQELTSILSKVSPVVQSVREALSDLNNPSEISIEFGLKIGGTTGIVFTSANAEANFKISVKWAATS